MDIGTSRLALRTRNAWEALDLGVRLWAERKGLYAALWVTYSLPLLLLLSLLFWRAPWWAGVLLWWLKPVFEAPILKVLSEQVFTPPPSYRQCVAATWRLLWRPRLLGDLTWRRFGWRRSLLLPVTVLEGLNGRAHQLRRNELARYGGGAGAWLSFFGIHFEAILTYGLLIVGYWLWFGSPVQDALVESAMSMKQAAETMSTLMQLLQQDDALWLYHVYNLLYALVLCFWGPIYVAAGFGLYLHARTLSEAWDVRLAARRLAARLGHPLAALAAVCLGFALLLPATPVHAETLPDVQQVDNSREAVLTQPPFAHLKDKRNYCWRSCTKTETDKKDRPSTQPAAVPTAPFGLFNMVLYALAGLVLLGVIALLVYWWRQSRGLSQVQVAEAPETLFGLAITPQSLPADVPTQVLHLWQQQDARAAMSLLYRASLAQLPRRHGIALRDSDTEGEVLQRVRQSAAGLAAYWQRLTHAWLQQAYAHRSSSEAEVMQLCDQYRQHFVHARLPESTTATRAQSASTREAQP